MNGLLLITTVAAGILVIAVIAKNITAYYHARKNRYLRLLLEHDMKDIEGATVITLFILYNYCWCITLGRRKRPSIEEELIKRAWKYAREHRPRDHYCNLNHTLPLEEEEFLSTPYYLSYKGILIYDGKGFGGLLIDYHNNRKRITENYPLPRLGLKLPVETFLWKKFKEGGGEIRRFTVPRMSF